MNTDEKKEIMENGHARKNEKYFDIPRGQVKHFKVNKRNNKCLTDILKKRLKRKFLRRMSGWEIFKVY